MNTEQKVDLLFKDLKVSFRWHSKVEDFVFVRRSKGWSWQYGDDKFDKIIEGNSHCIQQTGFPTRKAAAEYVDALLGTNIVENGFWCRYNNMYEHHQKELSLIKQKHGWILWFRHSGTVRKDGKPLVFKSRRAALAHIAL